MDHKEETQTGSNYVRNVLFPLTRMQLLVQINLLNTTPTKIVMNQSKPSEFKKNTQQENKRQEITQGNTQ